MLTVANLSKSFGSIQAVADISFEVRPGEIYGLLGPNGAGKTTTISCTCGLLKPDTGRVELGGVELAGDPLAFKQMIGVVPQEAAIYGDLTARENLRFWGQLAGLGGAELGRRIDVVLDAVGLTERGKDATRKFSGGMKRRLNLAIGMIHEPRLLLLDEPTVGIDVQARLNILDVVREVASRGTAVLYTTHYLEEAQQLCDRIGIMDEGQIKAEGTLDELKRIVGEGEVLTLRGQFSAAEINAILSEEAVARPLEIKDGYAMVSASGETGEVASLLGRLLGRDLPVDDISIQPPSLQGVFLKLTGRELRD